MISMFLFILLMILVDLTSLASIIIIMIFFSFVIFFFMWIISGFCWFSLIFSLLFVGGILVVFMVISSLFPNSKNYFINWKKKVFIFGLFGGLYLMNYKFSVSLSSYYLKSLIIEGGNFFSFMFLILSYFFCFLYFISKDKISLRSFY